MNFFYFIDKNQTDTTTYSNDIVPIKTIDIFI